MMSRDVGYGASLELVLIRHGQTSGNAARRYVGAIDEPLSDAGRGQARAAGVHPEVGRVYVSCKCRARETAALMFPNAEQVVVRGIEEMDFGAFGGRSADDMESDGAYRAWVEGGCEGRCPGGESRAEFSDRVCAALVQLCHDAAGRGEERVVVVAHGGTQMAFLSRFAPGQRAYYEWLTGNCEGYSLSVRLGAGDQGESAEPGEPTASGLALESVARLTFLRRSLYTFPVEN